MSPGKKYIDPGNLLNFILTCWWPPCRLLLRKKIKFLGELSCNRSRMVGFSKSSVHVFFREMFIRSTDTRHSRIFNPCGKLFYDQAYSCPRSLFSLQSILKHFSASKGVSDNFVKKKKIQENRKVVGPLFEYHCVICYRGVQGVL